MLRKGETARFSTPQLDHIDFSRPDARPRPSAGGAGGRSFGDKPADGDRAAYRRAPGAGNGDKAGAAGPGSAPMEFVSELFYFNFNEKYADIPAKTNLIWSRITIV